MRPIWFLSLALLASAGFYAQAQQDESSRKVEGGGISVPGWMGKVDAGEEASGKSVKDAKFAAEGSGFQRELHGESDVFRAQVYEPELTPASLRHCYRRQRYGHGNAKLPILRGVWERDVHCARLWTGALSNERPAR